MKNNDRVTDLAYLQSLPHRQLLGMYVAQGLGSGTVLVKRGAGLPHKRQAMAKAQLVKALINHLHPKN